VALVVLTLLDPFDEFPPAHDPTVLVSQNCSFRPDWVSPVTITRPAISSPSSYSPPPTGARVDAEVGNHDPANFNR